MTPLEQDFTNIARALWNDDLVRRRRQFNADRQATLEQFIRRGLVPSGILNGRLLEQAREELHLRGLMIFAAHERALVETRTQADPETTARLRSTLNNLLADQARELAMSVSGAHVPGDAQRPTPEFGQLGLHEIQERVAAEVALLLAKLQTTPAQGLTIQALTIGAVQTGAGASATVIQAQTEAERQRLLEALRAIGQTAKESRGEIPPDVSDDVTAMVNEMRTQATSEQPNLRTLSRVGAALAATIQSLAAMRPAYDLLRTALQSIGLVLP